MSTLEMSTLELEPLEQHNKYLEVIKTIGTDLSITDDVLFKKIGSFYVKWFIKKFTKNSETSI